MSEKVIIFGTGGNCRDMVDIIAAINATRDKPRYSCDGFLDDNEHLWGSFCYDIPVLGPLARCQGLSSSLFVNGIGGPESFRVRPEIIRRTGLDRERFATLIHPSAVISPSASIGRGVVVFPHVTICSNVRIGDHVLILGNSVINHDVAIGAHSCLTSGVCISGACTIGESCYLGANSIIREKTRIGNGSQVGMGSVVVSNVPSKVVVAGNPARNLRAM